MASFVQESEFGIPAHEYAIDQDITGLAACSIQGKHGIKHLRAEREQACIILEIKGDDIRLFPRLQGADLIILHPEEAGPAKRGKLEDNQWVHTAQLPGHDVVMLQHREASH